MNRALDYHDRINLTFPFQGEVRISKKVFDTEIGQKFGGQAMWHHVGCFVKDRSSLLFFGSGDMLPGFDSLKKEDQKTVKDELP